VMLPGVMLWIVFRHQIRNIGPVIDVVSEVISTENNSNLTAPFMIEEFKAAIFFYEIR